jgi:hypothetical protein
MSNTSRGANLWFLLPLLACAVAAGAFIRYFVFGTPVVTYRDENVACGKVRRPLDALAVHSGGESFIRVGGKTYRGVRGLQPFYLRLPRLHSILFVTDVGRDGVEFHIVRIGDWAEARIRDEKLSFGSHIGYPDTPGSPYTDFVEKEGPDELVLATRYPRARTLVFLDLKARLVTKVEYDELDESGRSVVRHVYVAGKRVE